MMLKARLVLLALATFVIAFTMWVGMQLFVPDAIPPMRQQAVPQATASDLPPPLPALPASTLLPVAASEAQRINAQQPFVATPGPAAKPFVFSGTPLDRERAVTCLAAAVYYEAGNDAAGQSAVAQVVINRLRHPAFPKTVCGVVFQGAEQHTGCQFTFACDGALARKPDPTIWLRARLAAGAALVGYVFAPVGYATHYHTDWVVPVWSASMDKLAAVHTHLFYRWTGYYGRPAVFTGAYAGGESVNPAMAALITPIENTAASPPLAGAAADAEPVSTGTIGHVDVPGITDVDLSGTVIKAADRARGQFLLKIEPLAFPGSFALLSFKLCADLPTCEVWGWANSLDMPSRLPIPAHAQAVASFHYEKTTTSPNGIAMWNCVQFPRAPAHRCMPIY